MRSLAMEQESHHFMSKHLQGPLNHKRMAVKMALLLVVGMVRQLESRNCSRNT